MAETATLAFTELALSMLGDVHGKQGIDRLHIEMTCQSWFGWAVLSQATTQLCCHNPVQKINFIKLFKTQLENPICVDWRYLKIDCGR